MKLQFDRIIHRNFPDDNLTESTHDYSILVRDWNLVGTERNYEKLDFSISVVPFCFWS